MLGIDLARPCGDLVARAAEDGLLISVQADTVIRLVPSLTMTVEEADEVLNPDALTIGFARRFATYKRATLLFRDIRPMIEGGNVAAALTLAGIQIAIGLLNAGAMAG